MDNKFSKCILDLRDHIQKIKIFKNENLEITIQHLETLEEFLNQLMHQVFLNIPSLNSSRVSAMEVEIIESKSEI